MKFLIIILFLLTFLVYGFNFVIAKIGSITINPSPTTKEKLNEIKIYNLIQEFRNESNLKPYIKSEFLCSIASIRLKETSINWSHNGFEAQRFCRAKICTISENLSKSSSDENAVVRGWLNSPSHSKALHADYTHSCLKSDGYYVVQIFGYY